MAFEKQFLFLSLLVSFFLCQSLISCNTDEIYTFESAEEFWGSDFTGSIVRFLHASPNAPRVSVYVNGTQVVNLGFPQLSNYSSVPSGPTQVQVFVENTNTSVLEVSTNLADGAIYTVVVTGFVSQLKPVLLQDDVSSQNTSKIRISHFSPDAPAVLFTLKNTITELTGTVTLPFGNSSSFFEFPEGFYQLNARLANPPSTNVLDRSINLVSGGVSSVFVVGPAANLTLVTDGAPLQPVTLPPANPGSGGGLSGGAVAAIVICSLIGACLVVALVYYFLSRRRQYETVP